MGFGARGMALGNALVADARPDASPWYNPALAPQSSRQHFLLSAAFMSFDRDLRFLQFAAPIRPSAGIAAGLVHGAVSDIDGRDRSGYHTRTYSTDEFAFFLTFGTRFGQRVSAGLGMQLFRNDLIDGLKAVNKLGIDLGLTATVLRDRLRFGLVVDDLLARYAWDTSSLYGEEGRSTSDRFPIRLRFGVSLLLMQGRMQLLAEAESRFSDLAYRSRGTRFAGSRPIEVVESGRAVLHEMGLRAGVEYVLSDLLVLRGGIDRIGPAVSGNTPSAGFAVEQPIESLLLRAEYGFLLEPHGTGALHVVTLRIFL